MKPLATAILFLLLLLASGAAADVRESGTAFVRLGPVRPPHATHSLRIREANGSFLEARGDLLFRVRGGTISPIFCTSPEGTGAIHALAADPLGATLVAADQGIFILSPEVDALDPLPLRDGAPPGRPLAVCMDQRRRIWVATDQAFACLEPLHFYGRTFRPEDGVPPGRPTGLSAEADGSIVLRTDHGDYRYFPGSAAPPTIDSISANGAPAAAGQVISLPFRTPLRIALAGSGLGGPTFRYRMDGQLLWKAADDGEIQLKGLAPGHRKIEIVALDRDLKASTPATLYVDVPWPAYWSPPVLLAVGLGVGALCVALPLLPPRIRRDPARRARTLISIFLTIALSIQLVAGLIPHARGWPIVGFSMYTKKSTPYDAVWNIAIEGLAKDGSRIPLRAEDTGLTYVGGQVVRPLAAGGARAGRAFVEAYNASHPRDPIAGVDVRVYRYRLTPAGPIRVAPLVMAHYWGEDGHEG